MRVLIAGGNGFLGREIGAALLYRGDQVIVASRNPKIMGEVGYDSLPDEIDAVVNLAGEPLMSRWTPAKKALIRSSRLQTTSRIASWLRHLNHKPVFLSASATGYYPSGTAAKFTEDSRPGPGFLSRLCADWEEAASDTGCRTVLLRFGCVLSPRGGPVERLLKTMNLARMAMPIRPESHLPWIGAEDAAAMTLAAIDDPRYVGPLNVVAPGPLTFGEMVRGIGKHAGRPVFGSMPVWIARLAMGEMIDVFTQTQNVEPRKALINDMNYKYPSFGLWLSEQKLESQA
jgi:uncharacterized protein (TIGR01777 family)